MAESLKDLRRRVRTVDSTRQITRAMEIVAASKLRRAQSVLKAGRPYAENLQRLLSQLAAGAAVDDHPLFEERDDNRRILVLFTAERGLCGAFNNNLIRLAENHLKSQSDKQWELVCIGKKGADYFKRRSWPIASVVQGLSGRPELDIARQIADDLVQRFTSGQTDSVHLYYQSFVSLAVYRPTLEKFLSLDARELAGAQDEDQPQDLDYILEPSAQSVFNSLLPRYLTSKIYITMAEVFTAEHGARMISMNNATRNCEELSDALTLKLNKARQGQITRELIDIVGGAEAVS